MKKILICLLCATACFWTALAAPVIQTVESSLIGKVGYDSDTQQLSIQMVNSSDVYYYTGVPADIYEGLMAAESKGTYYVKHIKGKYDTLRSE